MSKLFNLKRWVTLEEAAEHLGRTLQESVSVPDVLRLATEGHLVLSVNFVNKATANLGRKVSWDEARLVLFPDLSKPKPFGLPPDVAELLSQFPDDGTRQEQHEWLSNNRALSDHPNIIVTIKGDRLSDGVMEWDDETVTSIDGIWDLPTDGGAALDVEHLLQSLVGGPEVTLTCIDGSFVVSPDGQKYARLLEHYSDNPYVSEQKEGETIQGRIERLRKYPHGDPHSYYPRGGLPDDAPIVVRPGALTAFLASLVRDEAEASEAKPLQTRERNNLLRIIAGLVKESDIDLAIGGSGAAQIEAAVAGAGFDGPKEKTIRDVLAQVRNLD